MSDKENIRRSIQRLAKICNRFESAASAEKLKLMATILTARVRTGSQLLSVHRALCFIRAFPDSPQHYRQANRQLRTFADRVRVLPAAERTALWDSGVAGTPIHYKFSFEVATWMARRFPGAVSIDWSDIDDTARLDELLEHLLQPCETDFFDSGDIDSREWIELAAAGSGGKVFDWLLGQLGNTRLRSSWSSLYNAADLSLIWSLGDAKLSKSENKLPVRAIETRESGMRKRTPFVKKDIMAPISSLQLLPRSKGSRLIDAAMGSLGVRHRETYHFNHADPKEVYLADVGKGVSIAVFGLQHEFRFPLECTMGFLILSNGTPIGYGGSSVVFGQVNTGINIFDEYRGGEAAFLWIQVMRVYHQLTGCTRFIVDSYQFGNDNSEALESGAFWFYYRLGYRPIEPSVRKLAQRESARIRRDRNYRSDIKMLRRLASCDMHLTLPGARASGLFDERRLEISSLLATRELAAAGGITRAECSDHVARRVARDIGFNKLQQLSRERREAFHRLAPFVLAAKPATWNKRAKRLMQELLCAKGGAREADYARLLGEHELFLASLRKRCRLAERQLEM